MKATKKIIEKREPAPSVETIAATNAQPVRDEIKRRTPRSTLSEPARPRAGRSHRNPPNTATVHPTKSTASPITNVPVSFAVTAAPPLCSPRVLEIAAMFGLGVDDSREVVIVPPCEIPIPAPGIVFITGPSGSGKSTILRLLAQNLEKRGEPVIDLSCMHGSFDDDRPLIDRLGSDLREATSLLSLAGLGDAFIMLRREAELSDGQRFRFRLAQAMERAMRNTSGRAVIVADEFAATLDRLTAKTIARNIRRWIDRLARVDEESTRHHGPIITFIVATTHDDLLEPLHPEVLIHKGLGDHVEVMTQ